MGSMTIKHISVPRNDILGQGHYSYSVFRILSQFGSAYQVHSVRLRVQPSRDEISVSHPIAVVKAT